METIATIVIGFLALYGLFNLTMVLYIFYKEAEFGSKLDKGILDTPSKANRYYASKEGYLEDSKQKKTYPRKAGKSNK